MKLFLIVSRFAETSAERKMKTREVEVFVKVPNLDVMFAV
jgi:hypothetical protein